MKETILKERHILSWDDIGMNKRMHWAALNRVLQQAAVNHAEHLGFGFTDISKENVSWVLFRLHIQILRWPQWKEEIEVCTWPSFVKSISAFREFEIKTDSGELICNASSEWLIIDLNTRKPRRVEDFHRFDDVLTPEKTLTEAPPRYNAKGEFTDLFTGEVRFSHMDMNNHLNALHYFGWFSDAFYLVHGLKTPSFLSMTYFNECMLGEKVVMQQSADDPMVFRGYKPETGKIAFLAAAKI